MKTKHININPFLFLFITFLLPQVLKADDIPKNDFRSPVDFKITLSGTFAELRNNHFHSGIDIRTFTTGKKVYATADGIVSRIKISAGGYGKALYINHPNGYTSVYAHLSKFSSKIETFIKNEQYKLNNFEIDIDISKLKLLNKNLFKVKKGNIIAYSGNTGSSMGPHLHFEVRETESEKPINPMLLGLKIIDTTPPKIYNLYIYPLDKKSNVNGNNNRQFFKVKRLNKNTYTLNKNNIILNGKIGFAIHTQDFLDNTWNKCGINKLELKINDSLISTYTLNKFSFGESSYINSHIDYELNYETGKKIHKTFIEPNNKLSFYEKMKSDGSYQFKKNTNYKIEVSVYDFKKNKAELKFTVKGDTCTINFPEKDYTCLFKYNNKNLFSRYDINLKFPENCFYSDLKFNYSTSQDSAYLSPIHHIHSPNIALNKHYALSLKVSNTKLNNPDKLLIVHIDRNNKITSAGGIYVDGYVKTKTKELGNYAVSIDTIAPSITTRMAYNNKIIKSLKFIDFTIKDNLSGIESYQGKIDGEWVLFEFDKKKNRLFYTFDKARLQANKSHKLNLMVKDLVGNTKTYTCNFIW